MDANKVKVLMDQMQACLDQLRNEIDSNPTVNVLVNGAAVKVTVGNHEYVPERQAVAPPPLKMVDRMKGSDWPEAVPDDLLCPVEDAEEKTYRAEAVLDKVVEIDLTDLRFLDYGCGDGYMARQALARGAALSVGYDIDRDAFAECNKGFDARLRYTDDPSSLTKRSYDVILLHDVLDHSEDPQGVLEHVANLLAPGGTVFAWCHPWTSRHGGHLYRQFNKAYAHLFLDTTDLFAMGLPQEYIFRMTKPYRTYGTWFEAAGFVVRSEEMREEPLEKFFMEDSEIWAAMTRSFRREGMNDAEIKRVLELEFANYVLGMEQIH